MTPKLYTQEELDAAVERERGRVIGIFVGELQKLHEKTVLDCGDNSCLFATRRGGMRTNGGCRCIERLLDAAVARERGECAKCIPTTWLDPLLTGKEAVIPSEWSNFDAEHLQHLMLAIINRIRARSATKGV